VDIKQVGRELGVRYVIEGSVRKAANRVRITGQLIDSATGAHLWADRFEGALEDIFDLQDQLTASVVGAIAPKLEQAEIERAKLKPTESLDAYDYYLRGRANFHHGDRGDNQRGAAIVLPGHRARPRHGRVVLRHPQELWLDDGPAAGDHGTRATRQQGGRAGQGGCSRALHGWVRAGPRRRVDSKPVLP
jgi:hypothetical protein